MGVRKKALLMAVAAVFLSQQAMAEVIHLEAEDFKAGGQGVGYNDNDTTNNGGQYRPSEGVDIEGASEGGYSVGWTNGGEWLMLTTDPGTWTTDPNFAGGNYYLTMRAANGGGPLRIDVDGKTTLVYPGNTGGWQNWATTGDAFYPLAISPGQHEVKATFVDGGFNLNWVELTTDKPAVYPQTAINAAPLLPTTMGLWSVREATVNGSATVGGLGDIKNVMESGAGTVVDYHAPYINIQDTSGRGQFGGDSNFGLVDAGKVAKGSVDNTAVMMSARMLIPADGIYTFDVNSDDGFELSIDGGMVMKADYGKGTGDVFGRAMLTAGEHDIRVLYFEGGGGAAVEVSAAAGDLSAFDANRFRPIGYAGASHFPVPGLAGQATMEVSAPGAADSVHNLADAKALLAAGAGTTNTVVMVNSVNHSDPDAGGPNGGMFPGDQTFPNDTPGMDDNNFGVLVTGLIDIPEDGIYQIGYNGDDGGSLRVDGMVWSSLVEDGTGNAVLSGDTFTTDVPTGSSFTVGQAYFTAGQYPFEVYFFEIGGGASFELFGRGVSATTGMADPAWHVLATGGAGQTPDFNGIQIVPEPASLSLLGMGCLALLARRRRA